MPSPANNVRLLKWFNFFTDFRPHEVIMILYFAQVTGSYTLATSLYAIGAISSTVFEVPTGMLADRMGRRWTAVAAVAAGALGLAIDVVATSYWMFVPASILVGLAYAFQSGNNEALLYESLEDKDSYTEISGKVGGMFQLGLGAAALFTAILSPFLSFREIFAVSVIPQIIALCIALQFVEPTKHSSSIRQNVFADLKEAIGLFRTNAKLRLLSLGHIVGFGVGEAMWGVQSAFMALFWPTWAIGVGRAAQHIVAFAGSHTVGWWGKRVDELHLLMYSHLVGKILGIVTFAYPTVVSPALIVVDNYPWMVSDVTTKSLMQHQFTDHQRATMGSLNAFAGKLLLAIALLAIGYCTDRFGITKTLLVGQLVVAAGAGFHWVLFRREGKAAS